MKTFLFYLLLIEWRKYGEATETAASSGIEATLLVGGRTAHSVLRVPLNLAREENLIRHISKDSNRVLMLRQCKLLVTDEYTMLHKRAVETVVLR